MHVKYSLLGPERCHTNRPLVADIYFYASVGCLYHHLLGDYRGRLRKGGHSQEGRKEKTRQK